MKPIVQTLIDLCDNEVIDENSLEYPTYKGYTFYSWKSFAKDNGGCAYLEFEKRDKSLKRSYRTKVTITNGEDMLLNEAIDRRYKRYYEFFSDIAKKELGL